MPFKPNRSVERRETVSVSPSQRGAMKRSFLSDPGLSRRLRIARTRSVKRLMEEVMKAAGSDMAVLVKMNMRDGFRGGMELDETMQVARRLEQSGAHALVLSGGFVSKAPMYVMRGEMPIRSMTHYMTCWWLKYGVRMVGKWMIPSVPFKEAYFLEDALKFRAALKIPLVYVGAWFPGIR